MTTIIKKEFYFSSIMHGLLTILIFICFYPLIQNGPLTDYDDKLIVNVLSNVHSASDYFHFILSGKILDIQPVRDLSYFFDFGIQKLFSFSSFHLTNVTLWILICVLFKKILFIFNDDVNDNKWLIWSLVFLYALSPVFGTSVAWIAARKHLLSTFFILLATYHYLKKSNSIFIILFYLLSCLSQPINLLWPLFVFIHSYFEKTLTKNKKLLVATAIFALFIAIVNIYYYSSIYTVLSGGDGKYDSDLNPGLSLLALGRYFYLTLFPFDALPVSHYQGSWQNLIGLFLLVLAAFYLYKKRSHAGLLICFAVYFLIPLIPVTYKITRIFCSDTYVLNASIGTYVCAFLILKDFKIRYAPLLIGVYALICFTLNISYVKIFMNSDDIWDYAYAKEATPMSIQNVAQKHLVNGNLTEAKNLIDQLEIMEPENRFYPKLRSDLIYNDPQKSAEEKLKELSEIKPGAPIIYLRLALLHSNLNNKTEFINNIVKLFSNPSDYIKNSYLRNEDMLALVRVACEKNQLEAECKKHYDEFSKAVRFNDWNGERYKEAYFTYKSHPEELFYR